MTTATFKHCARLALQARIRLQLAIDAPTRPIDCALRLGLEVRMQKLPSLEGLYFPDSKAPLIVLGSDRPYGRIGSTTLHEIGHHLLGHGQKADWQRNEQAENADQDDKFINVADKEDERFADCVGRLIGMPRSAVDAQLMRRGWKPENLTAHQASMLAGLFGVGYTTFLHQCCWQLQRLSPEKMRELLKFQPNEIARDLIGTRAEKVRVVHVDEQWTGVPIDLAVNDLAILPANCQVDGSLAEVVEANSTHTIIRGVRPGSGLVYRTENAWGTTLRVSKRGYEGLADYRHLEDDDAN